MNTFGRELMTSELNIYFQKLIFPFRNYDGWIMEDWLFYVRTMDMDIKKIFNYRKINICLKVMDYYYVYNVSIDHSDPALD